MGTVRSLLCLIVGMLLSTVAAADNQSTEHEVRTPQSGTEVSVEDLLAASKYASRWQILPPAAPVRPQASWASGQPEIYFRDTGPLTRFTQLRSLSLLTLLDDGESRLFLGVNDRGVVGLHYGAFSHAETGETLEILRMPYLDRTQPETD